MRYLITGAAGFIGFHLAERLLSEGHEVVGIDAFTQYYDVSLKEKRNECLEAYEKFQVHRVFLEDAQKLRSVWAEAKPDVVVHLAAQAGVRYSIENPRAYIEANIIGTFNVLECAREMPVGHLMIASTSSVYGANTEMPFVESEPAVHPMTLYAATKSATEAMAHSYAHLWMQPTTAFRFFTVYGPWGRPDMALFKFTKGIIEGTPIDIYNGGDMKRDFTYVGDIVEAIVQLAVKAPALPGSGAPPIPGDTLSHAAPYRLVNIGGGAPTNLMDFIAEIERVCGKRAIRNYMPMQAGDVPATFANADLLKNLTGFRPSTSVEQGVSAFVEWYRGYFAAA